MKISFWITAVVLFCTVRFVFPNTLHVGTVLFTTTDIVKKCWTENDKALLRARLIMQDILPQPDCINFSKPGVVTILLDYFQSCYRIISSSTYGKTQNLMFLALSDAVGGYLRAYILPISKRAYYAGQMEYSETSKLYQLYNDIKMFLKTNGVGWAKPYKLCPLQTIPKPLVISSTDGGQMACDNLYIIERKTKFHFNRPHKSKSDVSVKSSSDNHTEQTTPCPVLHFPSNDEGPTDKELKQLKNILLSNERDKSTTEFPSKKCKQLPVVRTNASAVSTESESKDQKEGKRVFCNESATERRPRKRLQKRHNLENVEKSSHDSCKNENRLGGLEDSSLCSKTDDPEVECQDGTFPDDKHDKKVVIPLPVLDDSVTPFTLAVPFKCQPLRSIRGGNSAFLLEHYYVSVIKCMISKGSSKGDIKQFNGHFFSWLCSEVYPHLADEVWYPAFGGVLRITETIRKLGADSSVKEPIFNDLGYIFPNKFEFGDSYQRSGKEKTRDVGDVEYDGEYTESKRFITYGILISAVASLFALWGCIVCVHSLKTKKSCRPPVVLPYSSCEKPKHDESPKGSGRKQCSEKKVCYDGILLTKAERKALKKAEKKAKRERAKRCKREKKKLKRVPDWKETVNVHKGGGDRLPIIKLPWTSVPKKHDKGDSTYEENTSKCLVHDSSELTWPSQSPFIALQKLGSRLNTSIVETSIPLSTDVNRGSKAPRNSLDKIRLIWKKASGKSAKTYDDKETQDTEQLRKTSLDSTLESSKKDRELVGTLPSDSYTFSVEDERRHHHVKQRSTFHDRGETYLTSSGTTTSPSSETPETSSVESETDESCSSDSDSSRQTTTYR